MLTWLASCRITNRLLTPKGYLQLQELIIKLRLNPWL